MIIEHSRAARRAPLPRAHGVAHDVVDGELDEVRTLVAPPLALGAHLDEPPLDVSDFERPQLVFEIEVLCDQRLDLLADHGPAGFRRRTIPSLLRPRIGFQPKHLPDELRTDTVATVQFL